MNDNNKQMGLNIANIKFSVQRKKYYRKHSRNPTEPTPILSSHTSAPIPLPQPMRISLSNGFIPTTTIRKNKVESQEKSLHSMLLNTPKFTHSKFPYRKPRSKLSSRSYFPIFRQKMNSSPSHSQYSRTKGIQVRINAKRRVTSCVDLKVEEDQKGKGNFVRYSHNSLKTEFIERKKSTMDQHYQELGRVYFET